MSRYPSVVIGLLVVAAAALVSGGLATYSRVNQQAADARLVGHTHEMLRNIERILTLTVEADAGQRGYLLTGEEQHLQAYTDSIPALKVELASVRGWVKDNPAQLARLDHMEHLIATKVGELQTSIDVRREDGFESARLDMTTHVGKRRQDQIRAAAQELGRAEQAQLAARRNQAAASIVLAQRFAIAGSAGTVVALLLAGAQMGTELRKRRLAEESMRAACHSLENALVERTRALEQVNQLKDEFLATLSHELRTPLNAIVGWTYVLRIVGAKQDQRRHAVEGIERNVRAQTRLVEDLLDVSCMLQGRLTLKVALLDLRTVVTAARDTVAAAAVAKGVEVEVRALDEPIMVTGDDPRLQRAMWNLLHNAVKFTPKGGHVWVDADRIEGRARVRVRDSGEGITPAFLPCVFDDFRQGASTSMRAGSGLGLPIVRRLVELHGGTITAESGGSGRGSLFTATFPLADDTA